MAPTHNPSLSALDLFVDDQTLAFLWADRLGVITHRHGAVLSRAEPGLFLSDVVPVFHGLESDLARLIQEPGTSLDLPNIAIVSDKTGPMQRLNLSVRWDARREEYVILVAKALSHAAFEVELQQQVRARRLAETILVEQAEGMQETNAELARVNRELADFARLVTHDLKAPMRAMRYFTDDLESSLAAPGEDDPSAHINRLRAQSRRMTGMLSSLLAYATVERKADAVSTFDSAALVDQIIASLPAGPGVTIARSGTWPELTTIEALFDIVVRNLLENATRYATEPARDQIGGVPSAKLAAGTGEPAILVHGQSDDGAFVMDVCDNGPGIAPNLRAAVFRPFTQVEPQDTDDGDLNANTGMGLAIVQRAVETAGGSISVEDGTPSHPGARFRVILPGVTAAAGALTKAAR
ncbi:MAG: HAMP domain-containing sensor histidine kinase [Pseudomonadota bacterium]